MYTQINITNYSVNPLKYKKAISFTSLNEKNTYVDEKIFNTLQNIKDDKSALVYVRSLKDTISPVDKEGNHIIHQVVKSDFYETAKQMLLNPSKAETMLKLRGADGKTPLAVASSARIARLLSMHGANLYALDNFNNPAGLNEFLPEEVRTKVKEVIDEKLKLTQAKITSPEIVIDLKTAAAAENYPQSETIKNSNEIEQTVPEPKTKKNFFGIFQPKEEKPNLPEGIKEVKLPEETTTNLKSAKKPLSKIEIPNTEAFLRIDTPEIKGLDDLFGLDNVKKILHTSVVEPVVNEQLQNGLKANGVDIPNGILLIAPPGNGKTSIVKALGASANMPVFEVKDFREVEPLITLIKKNYDTTHQRAIVYLRGIDNLFSAQSNSADISNTLNRAMSSTAQKGVLIVMSGECRDNIPKSILTPGKIDRLFEFGTPDFNGRKSYITSYMANKNIIKDLMNEKTIEQIAEKTQGFSIAQLKHVFDETVINTMAREKEKVELSDLMDEIRVFSKEQAIPEINEHNKTSIYDTFIKRYQPTEFDAKDFESVAGMQSTKSSIEKNILIPWKNSKKLREQKIQLPAGAIFTGDPGTSKSYMAKAIARSLNIPLYPIKMSEIGSAHIHEVSRRIGQAVTQLIKKYDETGEPSILLMDEIDTFQKGHDTHGTEEVNTLLQEIERGRNKILFIGTTNEVESLPDSLMRDGRMGTVVHFEHCDADAAKAIIKNMLHERKNIPQVQEILQNEELLAKISKRCSGMVAASVSAIVNDSLCEMIIKGKNLEDSINIAVATRRKKDIETMLSQNSKNAGHRLNITEDSTLMYDTRYQRMLMSDFDPKNLDSLGGMQDVKKILSEEIIDAYEVENYKLMKENKIPVSKGFILYGPSGCGKTTIVKAIANQMGIPLYEMHSGNIGDGVIHATAKKALEFRNQLAYKFQKTGERSILFMDEAQQLVPKTSGALMTHSHNVEETNFFKTLILSAEKDGIIYAMATNDINQIEPAFYENADRLGVKVYVGYPDVESRTDIIKKLLSDRPIAKSLLEENVLKQIADSTEGMSISKISQSLFTTIRESIKTKTPVTIEKTLSIIAKLR